MGDVRIQWFPAAIASALVVTLLLSHTAQSAEPSLVVPDVRDTTIKTRGTFDIPNSTVSTNILYLKGPWQRREAILDFPQPIPAKRVRPYVTIARCDERRTIQLNDVARTFASSVIDVPHDRLPRLRSLPSRPSIDSGAVVNIRIDVVDTGERRRLGSRVASRMITTTTTDAPPGANTRSGVLVEDGWYVDVPPAGCVDWGDHAPMAWASVVRAGSLPDRVHFDRRAARARGLMIEGTIRSTSGEQRPTESVALIEFAERPLDASLFTIPESYSPALPRFGGGFDLNRTDTIANRFRDYWEELSAWAHSMFRF